MKVGARAPRRRVREGVAVEWNPPSPFRRRGSGSVSWVTLLLLLGLLSGAYLAWVFGPPFVLHYEVKQVVHDFSNRAVKNPNDGELLQGMVARIRSLEETTVFDEAGQPREVPTVDLQMQDVLWERTSDPPTLHVAFEYQRSLPLPFIGRVLERTYRVDLRTDIRVPHW